VDAETGDTLRENRVSVAPRGIGMMEMVAHYRDFRTIEGLRIPFRHIVSHEATGTMVTQLRNLDTTGGFPDDVFVLHPEEEGEPGAGRPLGEILQDPRAGLQRRR
jgi:hypothetical protein